MAATELLDGAPLTTLERTPTHDNPHHARRWLILAVLGIAQLMVVLDATVVNIALPTAQHALGFSDNSRQWVVTAYALAFGSLLLIGGRMADLVGRKRMFLVGLVGFAAASAVGGAATSFGMLVTARAAQGAFGALLAPAGLALLTTTFTHAQERGRAFGIYGAIAGAGAALGLLLGGVLTEYASWRWTMFVNLVFAAFAFVGGSAAAAQPALRPPAEAGLARNTDGLRRPVRPRLRLLPRRDGRLGQQRDARFPQRGRGTARLVRPDPVRLAAPVAADARRARPQPRWGVPGDVHCRRRDVRDLPVPDVLPAADARLQRGQHRLGLPADERRPGHHRGDGVGGAHPARSARASSSRPVSRCRH